MQNIRQFTRRIVPNKEYYHLCKLLAALFKMIITFEIRNIHKICREAFEHSEHFMCHKIRKFNVIIIIMLIFGVSSVVWWANATKIYV